MAGILRYLLTWLRVAPPPREQDAVDYRVLAESARDVIMQVGPDTRIRYVSSACESVLGWTPDEMLRLGTRLIHEEDVDTVQHDMHRMMAGDSFELKSFRMRRKDGDFAWLEGTGRMTPSKDNRFSTELVLTLRDIDDRKAWEAALDGLSGTDGLTGLASRGAFDRALEQEWRRAQRSKSLLSVILFDADHFCGVNDHFGHKVGDECLRSLAEVVQSGARRSGDLAARHGGEKMGLILPDADARHAEGVAERIRQQVLELNLPNPESGAGEGCVSVSAGVATAYATGSPTLDMPGALLAAAERSLLQAKQAGRNRVISTVMMCPREGLQVSA
jgi:diguanylate cyclase (GGDEF)-like protein/PAS domain S-box-containing protein